MAKPMHQMLHDEFLKDKDKLGQIKWQTLMVDEAHRLKNSEPALRGTVWLFCSV